MEPGAAAAGAQWVLARARQLPEALWLSPLYGGGFWVALVQLCAFYYAVGLAIHYVLPRVLSVKAIQQQPRKPGEVARDAFYSIGGWACERVRAGGSRRRKGPEGRQRAGGVGGQ